MTTVDRQAYGLVLRIAGCATHCSVVRVTIHFDGIISLQTLVCVLKRGFTVLKNMMVGGLE